MPHWPVRHAAPRRSKPLRAAWFSLPVVRISKRGGWGLYPHKYFSSCHFNTYTPSPHLVIPPVRSTEERSRTERSHRAERIFIPRDTVRGEKKFGINFSRPWPHLSVPGNLCVCFTGLFVAELLCPPHLSHPPVLGASCPASSVPRWVSGLRGPGDRGGGYNRAVSVREYSGWSVDVSDRTRVKETNC